MLHSNTDEQRELSITVVAILYNLLSLHSIENSTIEITKLYSTSFPKPHAHILLDNNAQREGPQDDYFFGPSKKANIAPLASFYKKRAESVDAECLTEFVVPGSVARVSQKLPSFMQCSHGPPLKNHPPRLQLISAALAVSCGQPCVGCSPSK